MAWLAVVKIVSDNLVVIIIIIVTIIIICTCNHKNLRHAGTITTRKINTTNSKNSKSNVVKIEFSFVSHWTQTNFYIKVEKNFRP